MAARAAYPGIHAFECLFRTSDQTARVDLPYLAMDLTSPTPDTEEAPRTLLAIMEPLWPHLDAASRQKLRAASSRVSGDHTSSQARRMTNLLVEHCVAALVLVWLRCLRVACDSW